MQLLQNSRGIAIKALSSLTFRECGCKHVRIGKESGNPKMISGDTKFGGYQSLPRTLQLVL